MLLSPYATHMNLASAPIANKYEYPVIFTTAGYCQDLSARRRHGRYAFWSISQPNEATAPLVELICDPQEGRKDQRARRRGPCRPSSRYGWRCTRHSWMRPRVPAWRSCSTRTTRLELVRSATAGPRGDGSNPEAFVAFSYPPDTFLLVEQAQDQSASTRKFSTSRSAVCFRRSRSSSETTSTAF